MKLSKYNIKLNIVYTIFICILCILLYYNLFCCEAYCDCPDNIFNNENDESSNKTIPYFQSFITHIKIKVSVDCFDIFENSIEINTIIINNLKSL